MSCELVMANVSDDPAGRSGHISLRGGRLSIAEDLNTP